ncbi:MAG: aminoglycoside phosphotransferase family protein, partial [Chloroflexota bacterium]
MLVDRDRLLAALRLPRTTVVDAEPLTGIAGSPERISITGIEHPFAVIARRSPDLERASNNIAVLEALNARAIACTPRLLAIVDGAAIETAIDGLTALAVVPSPGACEAAIDGLAALHGAGVREGLHWGCAAADLFPPGELPLHRLGFAAPEREAAHAPFAALREELLTTPFGFTHGRATADNVLLGPRSATFVDFEAAGFGPQLFDVAAFLLTAGLSAEYRHILAHRYGGLCGFPPTETAARIDLLALRWGIEELLLLPRRLILSLGDEASTDALR